MAIWLSATNGQLVNADLVERINYDPKRPFAIFSDGSEIDLCPITDGVFVEDALQQQHFVPALPGERATLICPDGTMWPMHLIGWRVSICGRYSYAEPLVAGALERDGCLLRTDRDGSSALSRFSRDQSQPGSPDLSGTHDQVDQWVAQWLLEEGAA